MLTLVRVCPALAAIDPPLFDVKTLFTEILIADEYDGWSVKGIAPIVQWPRTYLRQRELAQMVSSNVHIRIYALNERPVKITQETHGFLDLPADVPRNGTWMAFKYVFIPGSVLHPRWITEANPNPPIFFYLIKEIPDGTADHEFQNPLTPGEEQRLLDNLQFGYALYFLAMDNLPQRNDEARYGFRSSSDHAGISQSQFRYALMLYYGHDGDQDLVRAREYLQRSGIQWHPQPLTILEGLMDQGSSDSQRSQVSDAPPSKKSRKE